MSCPKFMIQIAMIGLCLLPRLALTADDDQTTLAKKPISDKSGQVLNANAGLSEKNGNPTPHDTTQHTDNQEQSSSNYKNPQDAQKIFEESLRQMMPLDNGQIQKFRQRSDERDKALLPVSPELASRTVRVSLEPGQKAVPVFTTANIATSLVFHDSTGQPWPITSVTNGAPDFFQVLKPELPDGNLLNIMPLQGYATSTIVVTLAKRDVPLVIRLEADSVRAPHRKADALVLFQLAHHGPKASISIVKDIRETVNSTMLSFLDRVPPDNSRRLKLEPENEDTLAWEYNGKQYLRTTKNLVWPAWDAVVNGASNTRCYEIQPVSRIMLSRDGSIQTVLVKKGI